MVPQINTTRMKLSKTILSAKLEHKGAVNETNIGYKIDPIIDIFVFLKPRNI